ncbi:MAG TPA: heme-binding protein [Gemmatimonadaceae bacterium]
MSAIRYLSFLGAGLLTSALATPARAQVASKKILTLDGARAVADRAAAEARRSGSPGVIAVVDDGGNLVYLERLDDTFPAGARTARSWARSA